MAEAVQKARPEEMENSMTGVEFSDKAKKEYDAILQRYPVSRESAILPVLYLAQEDFGCISPDVVEYLSQLLEVTPVRIFGTATFYTMYNRERPGKYHLQVCHNLSCCLNRAESLIDHIAERLQIKSGETTSDRLFTLTEVECLGACGEGPVIQVNDVYHVKMDRQKADELLETLRREGAATR